MRITLARAALAGCALTLLLAAAPVFAETIQLKAELKASNEVPPVQSAGSGRMTGTYDTTSKKLTWQGSYSGLSGNVTAAHFHGPAEPDKNAPVVVPLRETGGSFSGNADLTDAQAADLLAGRWYLNFHTQANPGGEIRGQVEKGS
jgi:hypothetical protein